jgi:branched-chain amino acid transport system substrate-binding protein
MKKGQQLILGAILIVLLLIPLPFVSACAKPAPPTPVHEYIIPNYADITGPFSEMFRIILPAQNLVYGWWNENEGKKIGVKLVNKVYDTRYDAAETASIHARAVVSDKPIAILTGGAAMVLPIMGKLSEQKIPVIHSTSGVSFFHQPGGWVFTPLRDYATLSTASIEWFCESYWKKPAKPRIVTSVLDAFAGKDLAPSILAWQKTYPKAEFVFGDILWHPTTPVELLGLARKIMEEGKPDYIFFTGTAVSTVAFYSAMRELGYLHKAPILNPPFLGLSVLATMMDADMVDGDFEYNGLDYSSGTEAHKIFVENIDKYGPGTPWGGAVTQYSFPVYMLTRAVERAVEKVGAANLTGQALYDELNEGEFKAAELYGLTGDIKFNPDDRLAGVDTVYTYQMKGGKVELLGKHGVSVISLPLKK